MLTFPVSVRVKVVPSSKAGPSTVKLTGKPEEAEADKANDSSPRILSGMKSKVMVCGIGSVLMRSVTGQLYNVRLSTAGLVTSQVYTPASSGVTSEIARLFWLVTAISTLSLNHRYPLVVMVESIPRAIV